MNLNEEIRADLEAHAEESYRRFASSLLPGEHSMLGVRLPYLRKMAKSIARQDWRAYLASASDASFEEIMLQGLVIGCAGCPLEERLSLTAAFVPKIRNWSVCDSFVAGLKVSAGDLSRVWEFLQPYLNSGKEFEQRFAIVVMLDYFIREDWLKSVLQTLDTVSLTGYYAKMAAAWTVAECFAHYPDETFSFLQNNHLDDDTYRKALRKITESRKVAPDTKQIIREMRKVRNV